MRTIEPRRLDRRVLVAALVSGAWWLLLLALLGAWPLALVGAAYVAAASVFLAWVYGHDSLTVRQEALAWVAPWLAAAALWTVILAEPEGGGGVADWVSFGSLGLLLGTGCYLVWQVLALIVRQVMAWKAASAAVEDS